MCHTRIEIAGPLGDRYDEILTDDALAFLALLHRRFAGTRAELLHARQERAEAIAAGADPGFLPETRAIREDPSWRVAGPGPGLDDRRVEITGPTDRKMTINAMNSGAKVWLADHEDANTPTWANMIEGQLNLKDAIRGTIAYTSPEGREYRLGETTPTIVFRPRGWHLVESHLLHVDPHGHRHPASASLVDFALYVLTNARALVESGSGPYLYLPKMESHLEARLWDEVFTLAEEHLGLDHGTIRATMLIETLPAAFEMEEMLYELRDHCAGLNAGRWDYIFSMIKCYRARGAAHVLPDRSEIGMTVPFMRAYTELLVSTCHRRGAQAIGGMSAFIPNRRDPEATERALARVAADKRREAGDGFDGSWVAHPGLVEVARAEFDAVLGDRPNQMDRRRDDVHVTAEDLLDVRIEGAQVTAAGVRANVAAGLRYVESWLRGTGAAAIDNLMEDVATAEISRSQLWQWIRLRVVTAEGNLVTPSYVGRVLDQVLAGLPRAEADRFDDAAELMRELCLGEDFPTFLTLPAYARFLREPAPAAA
ncbi:malate synthase A [Demequina maris]|uniref:malate synthase A n=1 Tax=Demequina maris TaxID=1638982 RepID=UPI000782FE8D|nr:malate synthase A [Demequina maris]